MYIVKFTVLSLGLHTARPRAVPSSVLGGITPSAPVCRAPAAACSARFVLSCHFVCFDSVTFFGATKYQTEGLPCQVSTAELSSGTRPLPLLNSAEPSTESFSLAARVGGYTQEAVSQRLCPEKPCLPMGCSAGGSQPAIPCPFSPSLLASGFCSR